MKTPIVSYDYRCADENDARLMRAAAVAGKCKPDDDWHADNSWLAGWGLSTEEKIEAGLL